MSKSTESPGNEVGEIESPETKTFEDFNAQIEELRPEIESLTRELNTLAEVTGPEFTKAFFIRAIRPLLLGYSGLGITAAVTFPLPEIAFPMAMLGVASMMFAIIYETDRIAKDSKEKTQELKIKSDELRSVINAARELVEEELIAHGATKDKRGKLTVTDAQVEEARKVMEKDLANRKSE